MIFVALICNVFMIICKSIKNFFKITISCIFPIEYITSLKQMLQNVLVVYFQTGFGATEFPVANHRFSSYYLHAEKIWQKKRKVNQQP